MADLFVIFAHVKSKNRNGLMSKKRNIINRRSTDMWKEDTMASVKLYNEWFLNFAPATFIGVRKEKADIVEFALRETDFFRLKPEQLIKNPGIITVLRMSTVPPLARERLTGLSDVSLSFLKSLEDGRVPARMTQEKVRESIDRIVNTLKPMLDSELFPWLKDGSAASDSEVKIAKCIVADRLCGTLSDPIIRNEQEKRQLRAISHFLTGRGYKFENSVTDFREMPPGTFGFHINVPVRLQNKKSVNMPIDAVIRRFSDDTSNLPLLVECKSAGDYTNTNKRRKEEAQKMEQLRATYGKDVDFILFLCGYFDSGYLGYEASEGIDWVWEHRIEDLTKIGV